MTHLTLFYFSPIGKQKFYSESIWKTWVKATSVYLNQILIYSPLQLGGLRNWTLGDVGPATCLDVEDIPSQGAQPTFILITQNKASQLGSFDNIDFFLLWYREDSQSTLVFDHALYANLDENWFDGILIKATINYQSGSINKVDLKGKVFNRCLM